MLFAIPLIIGGILNATVIGAMLAALGVTFVVLACWGGGQGILLFGPIYTLELVRMARRQSVILWRVIYVSVLFLVLGSMYHSFVDKPGVNWLTSPDISIAEAAEFSNAFVSTFLIIQFCLIGLMTPGLVSSVVAEEKDRRSIDFLLMTDLRSREVILGKSASRLTYLGTYVLAGLPVLALLPLFGGVDFRLVAMAYLATFVMVLGIAGVSIYVSVHAPNASKANGQMIGIIIGYLFFASLLHGTINYAPNVANFPNNLGIRSPVIVADLVEALRWGQPFTRIQDFALAGSASVAVGDVVWKILREFAAFHLTLFLVFGSIGIRQLRFVAASYADGKTDKPQSAKAPDHGRPPVTDRPILWKELHYDSSKSRTVLAKVARIFVFISAMFVPFYMVFAVIGNQATGQTINMVLRSVAAIIAFFGFGSAGGFAARTLERERLKNTLESLMLISMPARDILWQKWLGAFLSTRYLHMWMLLCFVVAVAIDAVSILAIPLLVIAMLIYHSAAVSMGIWCAVRFPKKNAASRVFSWSLYGTIMAVSVLACGGGCLMSTTGGRVGSELLIAASIAIQPMIALGVSGFRTEELSWMFNRNSETALASMMLGLFAALVVYGIAARLLFKGAVSRFEGIRGEGPLPESLLPSRDPGRPWASYVSSRDRPLDDYPGADDSESPKPDPDHWDHREQGPR